MAQAKNASVCIVGAGSMGIVTGYHLGLAGADVTFLVRPHRLGQLSRPQLLYCYDDNCLKTFSGYDIMTDPTQLAGASYNFVVITLDGEALRAQAGQKLTEEIGRAFRSTSTGVIIGSMGIGLRSWFIEQSGLAETQVTNSVLGIFAYEAKALTMPAHPGVKPDLLAKADYAYSHPSAYGFVVDLSAPKIAEEFAALYNRNGASQCGLLSAAEFKVKGATFAILMTMHLMGWPPIANIAPTDETWRLGVEAMREIQRLSIFGAEGLAASEHADEMLTAWRKMEEKARPLDLATFNRYHHGGKVNVQDRGILLDALRQGDAEGAKMPALRALIARLSSE